MIKTESVHLICTSPPYGSLKTYPDHDGPPPFSLRSRFLPRTNRSCSVGRADRDLKDGGYRRHVSARSENFKHLKTARSSGCK
jgi:hypothetical protein